MGTARPNTPKPDTPRPETAGAETSAPGTSTSGTSPSGASEPGASEPGAAEPGATAPGTSGPVPAGPEATGPDAPRPGTPHPHPAAPDARPLAVEGLTVRFAGLTALDAVSFTVEPGSVHAVIGPNGAGKSTCFNVLSGVYRATSGSVRFGADELTGLPPHRIAALGVARVFQNLALPPRATVADSLMLGRHRLTRSGFLAAGLRLPGARREEARHLARVREIAAFTGLEGHLDAPVGGLPYGLRKLVELARALCMEPRLLLLDEPVAGMTADERHRTAALIRGVRDSLGISVVLVEHDMGVVMRLADTVTVLDFGRRIAHGSPAQVQSDPAVVRAYLGAADLNAAGRGTDERGTEERGADEPGAAGSDPAGHGTGGPAAGGPGTGAAS